MRQTLRQIVAVLALGGIALSLVPNALAATYTDVAAANKLGSAGIIVAHADNTAMYNLGSNLLRQEAIGTAAKALGLFTDADKLEDYTCEKKFSDITEAWVCRSAELAAKAGLTNDKNAKFYPKANLSKYEAMLFALRSSCMVPADRSPAGVAAFAAEAGYIANAASFNGTAAATRGQFFNYVAQAMDDSTCDAEVDICEGLTPDDAMYTLLGCDDMPPPPPPSTGDVEVSLSDETPAGRTLPKGANGVLVASYVVEAGSEDALISGVKLQRDGVSDDTDVTNFTVLANGVRVTDSKDENSDDEVTLTLKSGGVLVQAGETVTLDVILDILPGAVAGAEVAVTLEAVTTAGDVAGLPVTGETFRVGTAVAPTIEVLTDGSVSAPELGELGADLFRFKVKNNNSNETISLEGITFEQTGSIDETSELANYKLMKGSEVLATVDSTDSKYVAFVLETPLTITQGNNVALKVVADVVGGAGMTVAFKIDQKLDVIASSAKYGSGTAVTLTGSSFGSVTVEAGTIALAKVDATATKIREDKDGVVLGSLTVTAAQDTLEIKEIGFAVKTTGGTTDANTYLDNVQLRDVKTGARYDLTMGAYNSVDKTREYYDTSFDLGLDKGARTFEVVADTMTTIASFDTISFVLSMDADLDLADGQAVAGKGDGGLRIEETSDDKVVSDITPSTLTWKKVEGSESGATFSVLTLADLSRVRGADDVTALQFQIEADESSAVTVDEIQALVRGAVNTVNATSQMVSQVALYKGSTVSEANLLDTVSGSNLALGVATFDGFEVEVAANAKQTFTVALSFVDGVAATNNSTYSVRVVSASSISVVDDENDDVTLAGTFPGVSARDITITSAGSISMTQDANNTDNKDAKTLLAGTSAKVFSVDVQAQNESVDVDEVVFTLDTNVVGAVKTASLYLGDTLIASNTNSDIVGTGSTSGNPNQTNAFLSTVSNVVGVTAVTAVAQISTVTPDNVEIGDTFTVTVNGTPVTVTATAATVKNVVDLLQVAIDALPVVTATDDDAKVTVTTGTPGTLFTITGSATNAGGSNNQVTTIATPTPNVVAVTAVTAVAQQGTLTITNVEAGDAFGATVNGTPVSFTATAASVSNAATGLAALINALPAVSATASSGVITIVADVAGTPFTVTSPTTTNIGGSSTITFKNLTTLVIPQETKELTLMLNTDTIGFEKVGSTKVGVNVVDVALNTMVGFSSGIDIADDNLTITTSKDVAIVPAKVVATAGAKLAAGVSQAELIITVEKGDNTLDASNTAPTVTITNLVFSELGNNADGYKIYKEGNEAAYGTIVAGVFTQGLMPNADLVVTSSATYVISPVGTVDKTYSPSLTKTGVVYTVSGVAGATGLTSNAPASLALGSKTY